MMPLIDLTYYKTKTKLMIRYNKSLLAILLLICGTCFAQVLCTDNTKIPQSERDVLQAIYDQLDGDNWLRDTPEKLEVADKWKNGDYCSIPRHYLATDPTWDGNGTYTVIRIHLEDFGTKGVLPSLQGLTNLQQIGIKNSSVPNPPDPTFDTYITADLETAIGGMNIYDIDFTNNKIEGTLDFLTTMPNLRKVLLTSNKLSGPIPTGLPLNIVEFFVNDNNINGAIPDVFLSMPNLEVLDVADNFFVSGMIDISGNPNLRTFSFSNTRTVFSHFVDYYFDAGVPFIVTDTENYFGFDNLYGLGTDKVYSIPQDMDVEIDVEYFTHEDNFYQWKKDGVNFGPQGDSTNKKLIINDFSAADEGNYYLVVGNTNLPNGGTDLYNKITSEVYTLKLRPDNPTPEYSICLNSRYGDIPASAINMSLQTGESINWYSTIPSNLYSESDLLDPNAFVSGGVIYGAKSVNGEQEEDYFPLFLKTYEVPAPIVADRNYLVYNDQNKIVQTLEARGFNVKWYNASGELLDDTAPLVEGQRYYPTQTYEGCESFIDLEVYAEVYYSAIDQYRSFTCDKFKPVIGEEYVFSAWVKEEKLEQLNTVSATFNTDDLAKTQFSNLLQELNDQYKLGNISPDEVYLPPVDAYTRLARYIKGGDKKHYLTIFNFTPLIDQFNRMIGFEFSFEEGGSKVRFMARNQGYNDIYNNVVGAEKRAADNGGSTLDIFALLAAIANDEPIEELEPEEAGEYYFPIFQGDLNVSFPTTGLKVEEGKLFIPYAIEGVAGERTPTYEFETNAIWLNYINDYELNNAYAPNNYLTPLIRLEYYDVNGDVIPELQQDIIPSGPIIEGWQQISDRLVIPQTSSQGAIVNSMTLSLMCDNESKAQGSDKHIVYFDDVRFHPFAGSMRSFVYHPVTQKLVSELDGNNFASFYEYDKEGQLIRIKKETSRGVYTINESRSGLKKD